MKHERQTTSMIRWTLVCQLQRRGIGYIWTDKREVNWTERQMAQVSGAKHPLSLLFSLASLRKGPKERFNLLVETRLSGKSGELVTSLLVKLLFCFSF